MPGISELLVILLIVALLFGTKKLRSMGGDLGGALRSFRSAVKEDDQDQPPGAAPPDAAAADTQDSLAERQERSAGRDAGEP